MDRGEVQAGRDAARVEARRELLAIAAQPLEIEQHDEQVPGVARRGRVERERRDLRAIAQRIAVERGQLGALLDEPVEPRELVDADRRLEIGEVVLEARLDRLVAGRRAPGVARGGIAVDAVEAQAPDALGDPRARAS